MGKRPVFKQLTQLEERMVPTVQFGIPWPEPTALTVSFVPDGTPAWNQTSNAFSFMNGQGLASSWQLDALRAFQTWAEQAQVNVGVVPDGGKPMQTGGLPQGDARAGDIRFTSAALGSDVIATTAPFAPDQSAAGTLTLNTNARFGASYYDVYTTMLQEAGHAFGLGNNSDINSPMYEYYRGIRTSLTSGDIANMRTLYGARRADAFDTAQSNATLASASALPVGSVLIADITTATDVDTYKFTTPTGTAKDTYFWLQTNGVSLLTARLRIYNAEGTLLYDQAQVDPLNFDPEAMLRLTGGKTFYVQVSAADSSRFAVGGYKLYATRTQSQILTAQNAIDQRQTNALAAIADTELVANANNSIATATPLTAQATTTGVAGLQSNGRLASSSDQDYYKFTVPTTVTNGTPGATAATPTALVVNLWNQDRLAIDTRVQAFNSSGQALATRVVDDGNDPSSRAVRVTGFTPGGVVSLRFYSPSGSTADYRFSVSPVGAVSVSTDVTGRLTLAQPQADFSLNVLVSQRVKLEFDSSSAPGATLTLVVKNAAGAVVSQTATTAGNSKSLSVYLPVGTYTVSLIASGTWTGGIDFTLGVKSCDDPIGTPGSDPGPGGGGGGTGGGTVVITPIPPPPPPT